MDAEDWNVEMRMARQLLGMPDYYTNSNIYIHSKEISPGGIFLLTPPEKYQLYFLLKGTMDVFYKKEVINIPEGKLFFLAGEDSLHFKPHSECQLLMVYFRELTDKVNINYFKELSTREYYNIDCSLPLFTIPEKLKFFAMEIIDNLSNKDIHPSTLELIFTFLRASFTPMKLAIIFHEMIEYMARPSDNKSMDHLIHTIDFNT